jgi:hypothetical protein
MIVAESSAASKDTGSDSESGAPLLESALMDRVLIQTAQCVSEIPKIIIWM